MCTVTVITLPATPGSFRLACNRDELLTRPMALPPALQSFADRHAVLPIDPASGGTWVAVNDAGLAMALLNVNRRGASIASNRSSRGLIIPSLLDCDNVDDAVRAAGRLVPSRYAPFRLVIVDGRRWGEVLSDGSRLDALTRPFLDTPLFVTSSGLGDDLVDGPRRELFDRMVVASPHRQDEFHAHAWPDRPHLSVQMSRADARTVSRTIVEVTADVATLRYVADDIDHSLRLETSCIQSA